VPVQPAAVEQYIFGGQFISVPAHSRIDVDLDIGLVGAAGSVEFVHNLVVAQQPLLGWTETLPAGQRLRLRYTLASEEPLDDLECRLWLTAFEGEKLALSIHLAELSVVPLAEEESLPETEIRLREIGP
jgi:hypothetical protein